MAKKARQKKVVTPTPSQNETKVAVKNYAEANSQLTVVKGEMEQEIQAVKDRYQEQITLLNAEKDKCFATVERFATDSKEQLFSTKRSKEWLHGVFGFRTGTPKVKAEKGFTLASALELAEAFDYAGFIREKRELNKQSIIAAWDDEEQRKKVAKMKLQVVQDETFFLEAKEEEVKEV